MSTDCAPRVALDILLAEVNVRVEAPEAVFDVLDATLSVVPRFSANHIPDVHISVQRTHDVWEIQGPYDGVKVLAGTYALPQVAGAIVTATLAAVATRRNVKALRATVLEKDGRGLAMIGDDWESTITLAAHLHGRGWRYVGGDNALLDPVTLELLPVQKALYVNSSAIRQFPMRYRAALEASPWYVTAHGIAFYAVDPRRTGYSGVWARSALLSGVVIVDGSVERRPELESVNARDLAGERFAGLGIDWARVTTVDLQLGGCVDTCDLIDRWFESTKSSC